jgi:hypothetical protein
MQKIGYDGIWDRRCGRLRPRRVPLSTVQKVLPVYRETYFDFNVRHVHEKLREQHGIGLSYTWVKLVLQGAGLVHQSGRRGVLQRRLPQRICEEITTRWKSVTPKGNL